MDKFIEIIKKKRFFRIKSVGFSMLPTLHPEDTVFFKKINPKKIRVDDIIFVYNKEIQCIHRVVYKKLNKQHNVQYFITKGDNNFHSDGKIHPSHIYGVAYQIKRENKIIGIDDVYLVQSSIYLQEILIIKKMLEKNKHSFLFLKGLPIHLYYEKTHPRRVYSDCDLLVKQADWPKIKHLFQQNGYKQNANEYSSLHKNLKNKLTEVSMYKMLNNFPVIFDIHFEPVFLMNQIGRINELYPERLLAEMTKELFKQKTIVVHNGNTYPILSPPYLIMYLSLHFFHHNFREAFRLKLIENVIKSNDSQNNEIFTTLSAISNRFKINNYIYPVFLLLKKYKNCDIPETFLLKIQPNKDILQYIHKNILNIDIFSSESKITAGVQRFKYIFFLSPNHMCRKILILGNISILYSLFWVLKKNIKKMLHSR